MRDLIGPDELARFWVNTGSVVKLRRVMLLHSPGVHGVCAGCRSRTVWPCMFNWAAEQAELELARRAALRVFRR